MRHVIYALYPFRYRFQCTWNGVSSFNRSRDIHILVKFCTFLTLEIQKVGHILHINQLMLCTFYCTPETGSNALEMEFLALTVLKISTF
jgi:hypothetical protein